LHFDTNYLNRNIDAGTDATILCTKAILS